ncbi:nuclear transport factor 2 family protein [Novosphingobium panipatense]|jgi:hypothetical protein|uniref:nuclear transport factor 2 family protein n=1 Tax=Novosphingobium TaxID=165696 RepID=UPI000CDB4EE2|nr:nuclear transport factor 2 family protein [Novosphingobium sp. HII-3]
MTDLEATVAYLKDRQDILDCIVRECRARDRQDAAQIASCWWEDGVDEHGAVVTVAPDYPERANAGHRGAFQATSHNITNHLCEIDGTVANCETYVVGGLFWKDSQKTSIAFGRYLDRLEKRGGEWRIVVRRCTIEMTADADPGWVFSDAIKGFLKHQWSREDPSYERPITWKPREEGLRW